MKQKDKVIVHTSLGKFNIEFDDIFYGDMLTLIKNGKIILEVKDNFVIEWL